MADDNKLRVSGDILTLEEFEAVIGEIRESQDASRALRASVAECQAAAGNSGLTDFFDPWCLFSAHIDTLVKVLVRMFADEDGWIEWWLWDCECGRDANLVGSAYDDDGKNIPMGTAAELYAHLVKGLASRNDA